MPYVPASRRDILKNNPTESDGIGDANYLFTLAYLKVWLKEGNQRYKTIHALKKASFSPHTLDAVGDVEDTLTVNGVTLIDREVARSLAFSEFYRRIAGEYEDLAILKNGDVPEYEKALDLIFETELKRVKGE